MELAFDHLHVDSTGFPSRIAAAAAESQRASLPDWSGLRARFLAAHALRRELALACAMQPAGGSFMDESMPVLAAGRGDAAREPFNCSQDVNLTASANGKSLGANDDDVVGNLWPTSEEAYD